MRHKDWEILKVGDTISRVKIELSYTDRDDGYTEKHEEPVERVDFQIVQIEHGTVTAVRLIDAIQLPGSRAVMTETVELTMIGACADFELPPATSQHPAIERATLRYEWLFNPPMRGEARLSGGFTVTRADGTVEKERCPTDTTRV